MRDLPKTSSSYSYYNSHGGYGSNNNSSGSDRSQIHTIYGKRKPGHLPAIRGQDHFDWQKHLKNSKNMKKVVKEQRIAANII